MGECRPIGREILIKGYLRKAPSTDRKSKVRGLNFLCTGCHILLEPRWKKRFCVFYKIRNPNETQIFFEYYKNEWDKHPRGGVDLNSCDCIYEQKACNRWPNVFVVKTTHRGKRRDYLFSANSLEEMNDWISQLTKALHMVPDRIPGSPLVDVVGRNSSSLSHFTSRRPVVSTVFPPSTTMMSNFPANSNQFKEIFSVEIHANATEHHRGFYAILPSYFEKSAKETALFGKSQSHLDRGFTEEYRTSFGEVTADDEDCYRVLPQPDHAYVNLKGDGSAAIEPNFQNDQDATHDRNGPRPDSVYFNVWDSPTVDANISDGTGGHVPNHTNPSETEQLDKEASGTAESKEAKIRCHPRTEGSSCSIHENFTKTQLPKRSRNHSTSSSSSAVSFDDGDGNESDGGGNKKRVSLMSPRGAGEAEVAASPPHDFTPSIPEEDAGAKSKNISDAAVPTTGGSAIHYLDAENLDFHPRQRGGQGLANAFPAVPPKPVHLRRMAPAEATATGINASNDVTSSGYNELDPRSTHALFMVTRRVFGDADEA